MSLVYIFAKIRLENVILIAAMIENDVNEMNQDSQKCEIKVTLFRRVFPHYSESYRIQAEGQRICFTH